MRLKFNDGTEKKCSNPIEQKLFKKDTAAGWLCLLTLDEAMSSSDVDELLTPNNIEKLIFMNDDAKELFTFDGYSKVTSVVVRHSGKMGSVEIQLLKGA